MPMKNLTISLIILILAVLGCSRFTKRAEVNERPANQTQAGNTLPYGEDPRISGNANSGAIRTEEGVLNDEAVALPKPVYPPAARAVRAKGQVIVKIEIDPKGEVIKAEAVSGHPMLKAAAVAAARQAKFKPAPAVISGTLVYNFEGE